MRYKVCLSIISALCVLALSGAVYAADRHGEGPPANSSIAPLNAQPAKGELKFRIDTHPELDFYQPCDGGDNVIDFPINVTGVDPTTVTKAKLTLAVWDVDYNCGSGCCERDTVAINGHPLSSPMPFLTGANDQWSTVTFDVPPAFLVTGDNNIRIDIDTACGDSWCVSCDWAELTLSVGPEIEDIETLEKAPRAVSYTAQPEPEANKPFFLHAKMKNMDGYELVKVAWSGDIPAGSGEYYPVTIMPGNHGKKNVTAKVTYRKIGGTTTGTTEPKTKEIKVFFTKSGDYNRDRVPNWFEYWKQDGAVPNMGSFTYTFDAGLYGEFVPPTTLHLGSGSAETHYPTGWTIGGITFGGAGVTGIDCAAEVCAHELYHKWVYDNFTSKPNYPRDPLDSDGDELSDEYETNTSKTKTDDADTYDVAGIRGSAGYSTYGDQEWMAMKAGHGKRGTVTKDWAKPGKQTAVKGIRPGTTLPRIKIGFWYPGAQEGTPGFTGAYTDHGTDADTNGLFDSLTVGAGLSVPAEGDYNILGELKTATGALVALISEKVHLTAGASVFNMEFDGIEIHRSGIAGPYLLSAALANQDGEPLAGVENAYTTAAYAVSQFEGHQAYLGPGVTDVRGDPDTDARYETLEFAVDTVCTIPGTYEVRGFLADSEGNPICPVSATVPLVAGPGYVKLIASGPTIRQTRKNGPYRLMYLEVIDGEKQTDFKYDAYWTPPYPYGEFESGLAEFGPTSSFTDMGVDNNANSLFDVLRISMPATVHEGGLYALSGRLYNAADQVIGDAYTEMNLDAGPQTLNLDFDGRTIFNTGTDGPYRMAYALLYDPTSEVADGIPGSYTTGPYLYPQFEGPSAVALTKQFDDRSVDTSGDGVYDYLDVDVGVVTVRAGTFALNARLADKDGAEIGWAAARVTLPAGARQMITLRFQGSAINSHGVPGPFRVQDFYIYDTSDTALSDTWAGPYITKSTWTGGDTTPPAIAFTPDPGTYFIDANTPLAVRATADDAVSGVDYVTIALGGAPATNPYSISAPGHYSFEAEARDKAGNRATQTAEYTAQMVGWLSPATGMGTAPVKAGAIVPVKFTVMAASNVFVSGLAPMITVKGPAPYANTVWTGRANYTLEKRFRQMPRPCYQALVGTRYWRTGTYTATLSCPGVKNTLQVDFGIRNFGSR